MARNFFGGRRGMVNPLAALLMQQDPKGPLDVMAGPQPLRAALPMLQDTQQGPPMAKIPVKEPDPLVEALEADAKLGPIKSPSRAGFWFQPMPDGGERFDGPQRGLLPPPSQMANSVMGRVPEGAKNAADLFLKLNPATAIPKWGYEAYQALDGNAAKGGANLLSEALGSGPIFDKPAVPAPKAPPAQEATPEGQEEPQGLLQRLDAEKGQPDPSMQGFGAALPPGIQSAVEDTVKQYGLAQQDYDKAMLAMKKEFEDTPEIDEALSNAKQALDQARLARKQPSAWDFVAIALLNLSGQDPRMSADMVLGMGDQQRQEERLEDQVMGLQGAQIQGRMGGRRDFRQSMLQQQLAEAERQQRAQIEAGKERRWQADYGLKQQDQASSLLRALAGQEAETQRFAPESEAGKKAGVSRDLLKKLMQMDDSSLQRMLQQRQQPAPQDMRQSRMFGRPGGGLA